jgi:heptosyltransferase-2
VPEESFREPSGAVRRPHLYISDEARSGAETILRRLGLAETSYVALAPGAKWATKRWPMERYAELASGLASGHGLKVLLLGSGSEMNLCKAVMRSAGQGVISAAGEAALGETGGLISRARLFVGNDSGPTHMAMALGVPTVALFGPTDPGQFDHSGHGLVYGNLDCSACSFYGGRSCPRGHWDCLMAVRPAEVLATAERLLERERQDGASSQ